MNKILLTGGCGFIGANLIREKLRGKYRVSILDNLSAGDRSFVEGFDNIEVIVGDIRDKKVVERASKGADFVIHLAAHTGVVASQKDPQLDLETNVLGTLNLLKAAVKNRVKKFIFASTGGAIVGEQKPPIHERMAPAPLSPYGASKLAAEGYLSAFNGSFGLNTVSLRFSNVYGPFSRHKGSVVASFFKRIQAGEPIEIFGDGSQTRDFLYVSDLCEAIMLAIKRGRGGEVYQIASGKEESILSLLEKIKGVVKEKKVRVAFRPARPGEVMRNFASIAKAKRELGFVPKTPLADGLRRTWEYFQRSDR